MSKPYRCSDLHAHEAVQRIVPKPSAEEYEALKDSIKARGVLVALHIVRAEKGYRVIDGHHRLLAAQAAGKIDVPCVLLDGLSSQDEIALGIELNGARRNLSFEGKRTMAVATLKEVAGWSDRRIADLCGLSHPFVGTLRAELISSGDVETVTTRTDSIGRQQPAKKPPRVPAVADLTEFRDRPKKADRVEQLRQQREEQAPAASPYFDEPAKAETPGGNADAMAREARLDREMRADAKEPAPVSARKQARAEAEVAVQEHRESIEGRITAYVRALPAIPELDDAIGPRSVSPGYAAEMRAHIAFMVSVLERVGLRVIA